METPTTPETISNVLGKLANEYGAQAADAVLFVYQVEAIKSLVLTIIFLGIAVCVAFMGRIFLKESRIAKEKLAKINGDGTVEQQSDIRALKTDIKAQEIGYFMLFIAGGMAFVALIYLMSPYTWMAAFGSPEAMMAKKALTAAGML